MSHMQLNLQGVLRTSLRIIFPCVVFYSFAGCTGPAKNGARTIPPSESLPKTDSPDLLGETTMTDDGSTQQVVFKHEVAQPNAKKTDGGDQTVKRKKVAAAKKQSVPAGKTGLTLPELLMLAVENNPSLAAARSKAAAHGWRVPQVTSLDDPMVSGTVFLDSIETAAGAQDVIVNVSQKFPSFGKLKLRGEFASADAESLWWRAEGIRIEIVEQVQLAYFDLAYLTRAHQVLKKLEPNITSLVTVTRTKFRNENDPKKRIGFETVLQAEVELYRLRTQIAEIEEAQKRAKARLKELIDRPQDQTLAVQVGTEDHKVPADLNPLLALIDECQPNLLARMWESQRDAAGISLSKKNYYPDMSVGLNWYGISNSGLSPVANGDDAVALTFGINVPVYRNKLKAAESEAQQRYHTSRNRQQSTSNRFRSEVAALHAQARSHDRVLKILNENIIRRARRALDLSLQSWRQDRIEFQRLIDNYKELVRFEISILQHRRSKNQTLASLERAVGCAVESWAGNSQERRMR